MRNILLAFSCLAVGLPAQAILTLGGEGRSLSPPVDPALRACWELQGQWGKYLGTPIAPRWFLTAGHIGGEVGDPFWFAGQRYTVVALEGIPGTDLALWRVDRPFPRWAARASDDPLGAELFLVGRGTARGERLTTGGGWRWGNDDHQQSWGSNHTSGFFTRPGYGELLLFTFDADSGPSEGTLSQGDSGGGVFLRGRDGIWRLAGVNHDINPGAEPKDRLYTDPKDPTAPFFAAVYDGRGLALDGKPLRGDQPHPMTGAAARVAPYARQIEAILARPDSAYPRSASILQTRRGKRSVAALLVLGILLLLLKRRGKTRV